MRIQIFSEIVTGVFVDTTAGFQLWGAYLTRSSFSLNIIENPRRKLHSTQHKFTFPFAINLLALVFVHIQKLEEPTWRMLWQKKECLDCPVNWQISECHLNAFEIMIFGLSAVYSVPTLINWLNIYRCHVFSDVLWVTWWKPCRAYCLSLYLFYRCFYGKRHQDNFARLSITRMMLTA